MSIPLVQNNEKDSINTSIIAIKRNIERINMLLGLSNSEEIDTSEFVKKSDIVDVVEAGNMNPVTSNAVVPVDEVTLGNMQSVSSDGVAKALEVDVYDDNTNGLHLYKIGKIVIAYFQATLSLSTSQKNYGVIVPERFRPKYEHARAVIIKNSNDTPFGQAIIQTSGVFGLWGGNGATFSNSVYYASFSYICN